MYFSLGIDVSVKFKPYCVVAKEGRQDNRERGL